MRSLILILFSTWPISFYGQVKSILISSGQFSQSKPIKILNSTFDIVTNESDTIYLSTSDKTFQTPEGYMVGTRLADLPQYIKDNLTKEQGWGYYFKLLSGSSLAFCEGKSCADNYPGENSTVKWIFKRKTER
jgi:hypothetical protein